jgi:hypothetical protein
MLGGAVGGVTLKAVERALEDVRTLMQSAAAGYKIVGGLAVIHHGYPRFTEDIDVLVDAPAVVPLSAAAAAHGCTAVSRTRLRHDASGVTVDLLVAGDPMPRRPDLRYPPAATLEASPRDPNVAGLPALLELKLRAHRHQDVADVVGLLKVVDDARYVEVESRVAADLRVELANLRDDALAELAAERDA